MSVKILVDSISDISQEEADKMGVVLLPVTIRFQDEEFLDGVNMTPAQFYEKLESCPELPKTSQITPYMFDEAFSKLVEEGYDVVAITMSSLLSGTYANAKQVAEKYGDKVCVVDSMTASAGERILCQYAVQLQEKGLSAQEIAEKLEKKKSKVNLIAMLSTLKFLKKGGRISSVIAFAGEMLSIKPIIEVKDGIVKVLGKTIGVRKAFNALNDIVDNRGGIDLDMPSCYIYSGTDKVNIEKYMEESKKLFNGKKQPPLFALGGGMGCHIGPNGTGLAFFEK